ncbi:PEP-CTERM sorting domain-containing protein [Bythopirellula goksoeyrii]|uniref:Ice-binding protein C-terminal domain-containing protein n=1 Tax=Bythopirellula goksoeyrii TaxID=1400387 RepID=A0A5B9QJL5_9BACT|nr:PEP-CTERM sorting domain-containing protein [Bythopirellula goksoeyrii]QEG37236.1 hypothetical protein Pr1d_45770 [Bythopirellula goksoeyrii]
MRCSGTIFSLITLAALLQCQTAQAQVVLQDFEGPLPGPQEYPGGWSFSGGGADPTPMPIMQTQISDQVAAAGIQSFQLDIDGTPHAGTWGWYGGFGGFFGFYGPGFGFAAGQAGAGNPANYEFSFDIMVQGNTTDTPVGGSVSTYDPDLNDDEDPEGDDGANTWSSEFTVTPLTNGIWNHVVWQLDSGTPPTSDAAVPTPYFDDETNISFQLFFNNGGFDIDSGNIINFDNIQLEFIPPTIVAGDFDEDGDVDGNDFLVWQRDQNVGSLSDWQDNYNAPASTVNIASVPEPASLLLALSAALFAGFRRRRS